ncbi:hypothetical protein JCM10207_001822 [Rhodosporidiobolus poonsookiae]
MASDTPAAPPSLTPALSLDLRLRFLEQLVRPTSSTLNTPSIARRAAHVQQQLDSALQGTPSAAGTFHAGGGGGGPGAGAGEAVRRFVHNYDLNAPLLSVAAVPLAPSSPDGTDVSPHAKVALILECENEIRTLECELRELGVLDERGVVGAGKLGDHEALKPDLAALQQSTRPVASSYASLEARTTALLQQYNDYIANLSELFVSWNDILSEAEDAVTKLEKEQSTGFDVE